MDRPASPVPDNEVPASTLASVPISGSAVLARHLEQAAEEQAQEEKRGAFEVEAQLLEGRVRSQSNAAPSIHSVLHSSKAVGKDFSDEGGKGSGADGPPSPTKTTSSSSATDEEDDPTPTVRVQGPSPPVATDFASETHPQHRLQTSRPSSAVSTPTTPEDGQLSSSSDAADHADSGPQPNSGSSFSGSPNSLAGGGGGVGDGGSQQVAMAEMKQREEKVEEEGPVAAANAMLTAGQEDHEKTDDRKASERGES